MSTRVPLSDNSPSSTAWLATVIAGLAFAVFLTLAWVGPRMQDRLDDAAAGPATPVVTAADKPDTGGTAAVGLDPAGPTLAGPDSMAWVFPELVAPFVITTLWGAVLAWVLLFRPRVTHQALRLADSQHQIEDLRHHLDSAASVVREREEWVRRVEDDLVRVRGEMVELERQVIAKLATPPPSSGAPGRRSTDPPQRRRDDDPGS